MNLINSLIIEGTIENLKINEKYATFHLLARRIYRNANSDIVGDKIAIDCEAWDNLKDLLASNFDKKSIRVVGRLK